LFIETLLAYVDMQELAVLAPLLRKEIGVGIRYYHASVPDRLYGHLPAGRADHGIHGRVSDSHPHPLPRVLGGGFGSLRC
jgi:hypothetical protein